MAISDERQRYMPMPEDRIPPRGKPLAYPEAVQLLDPMEPEFKGEVKLHFFLEKRAVKAEETDDY